MCKCKALFRSLEGKRDEGFGWMRLVQSRPLGGSKELNGVGPPQGMRLKKKKYSPIRLPPLKNFFILISLIHVIQTFLLLVLVTGSLIKVFARTCKILF